MRKFTAWIYYPFTTGFQLFYIHKFSSYIRENAKRIRYKDQTDISL